MYYDMQIETYKRNGKNYVYLSNDGSSGCEYPYENQEQLEEIVCDYVRDMLHCL